MKGKFWRKTLAACLALLLVSGNVPIKPVADLIGSTAITASAEGNTITIDANGQTISNTTTWENCTVNITGNGTVTFSKRIIISGDVTLNISSGATLTASIGIAVNEGNSLTIDGKGTLNTYGAMYNAGIGGEQNYNAGTIIINDGTINAYGDLYGAGIGGGQKGNGGNITINGGTVNADSKTQAGTYDGFGAGIGGGYKGSGGNITINGGVIVAKSNIGTGIGGGYKGNGGNIAITGGTVTATTYDNSAGIGGGGGDETTPAGNGGTIAISGGQITVTSAGGYGIGAGKSSSGDDGEEGTITLSWTDESDFISASSYVGDINFVVDKRFYYYDTKDYATKEGLYKQNRKIVPAIGDVRSLAMAKISMESRYCIPTNGTAVNVDYSVYDYNGNELTLGTDYTAVIKNSSNQAVSNIIDEGDYTLTVTAKDGSNYTGSQTVDFSVVVRPEGLSIDDDYTKGQDGFYYINMPQAGTNTLPLPDGFTSSFKVYDDGGKDGAYSNGCEGYLLLTAPEGYVFQLSGSIKTELWDYLYVYDGNDNNAATLINRKSSSTDGSETTVGPVVSSGQSILLYFHTDSLDIYSGLDLVVSVIPDSTKFPITVNQTAGGNVEASATQAKSYDKVNLTSTPESGYLLKELSITDASENNVSVEGGWYTNNCASFIMPGSAVTVKPTFTNELSAEGGLYINMPKTGTQTATIPANVESFKIYDDGGKDGKYSYYCDGNLILTAPEGYVLKLSGSILTQYAKGDELSVYDGDNTDAPKLLNAVRSADVETVTFISTVVSSGRNMMLHFNSDGTWVYDGLDLTVTLVKSSAEFAINGLDDITGGTIEAAVNGSNVTTAKVNDVVSITISPESGYLLTGLTVTDGDGRSLDISDILWNNDVGTFSFTMPDSNVTITPTFINTPALYYKIPVFGSQEVTIPSGVQSFKVYDDGGYYNNYSYNCNGTLILTAPTGYVLQLSGNITTDNGFDLLTVYDGDDISTKLIDKAYSSSENTETAITTVTSSGQSMRIFFTSNDHYNYAGLDLTVTVVPITYTVTWIDGNGDTLKTEQVAYGETPVYTGNTPTKTATAQYSYTFTGWDTTPAEVTGNATYTAQFSQTVNKYTVTWKNGDTVLETDENVEYGTTPEYNGETPTKPMDDDYIYTFSGWSPEISSVEEDIIYTAQFTATARRGDCGVNATWCFDPDTGTLTISGTGAMYNYDYDNTTDTVNSPWFAYKDNITSVEIENGVTSISEYAFADCTNLASVEIPDSVEIIGVYAFYCCTSLSSITIPVSVTSIGKEAFNGCTNITDVYCYAAPANLTWNDGDCDDFIETPEHTTVCHIPAEHIDDYNAKFGAGSDYPVNVRFVGDLVDMGLGEHLYGHSITLDGSIGVNFYVELTDELLASETAEMIFTVPNGSKTDTQTLLVKDVIANDKNKVSIGSKTYYKFKCSISAKDMASTITAQLVDGESKGKEYTYSVKDYAEYILEHNEVEEYANAAPLIKAMLNYGAASQTYFGVDGTLANDSLTETDKALGDVTIPETFKFNEANATLPEGVTFEGATLSLKSETTLSLYFKGLADSTEFICNGKTVETAKNGDYVVARIRGINASELEKDFTVKFEESSETYNVKYNVMTYCYNVLNDGTVDDNLQNVCKALYKYAQAAKTYSE